MARTLKYRVPSGEDKGDHTETKRVRTLTDLSSKKDSISPNLSH